MWFLILEILFLLALAALFGAWLAWWWLSQQPDQSYVSHDDDRLTRTDIDNRFAQLSTSVASLKNTDVSPIEGRLGQIEGRLSSLRFPETDLSPVERRLQSLEQRLLNREPDADRLSSRLVEIESTLSKVSAATAGLHNTDTSNLEARVSDLDASIRAIKIPEIELGPIHSGLTRVEMSLDNLDTSKPEMPDIPDMRGDFATLRTDVGTLETRLGMIQQALADNRESNGAELSAKFSDITTRLENMPQPDLGALHSRLSDLEAAIAGIELPAPDMRNVDEGLSIVHGRLASLETSIGERSGPDNGAEILALQQRFDQVQFELSRLERMEGALGSLHMELRQSGPNLEGIEQRLAVLQADLDKQPAPDMTPVMNSFYAMERRMDLGSLENRLTSIEYGLAALHHSLRTRMEDDGGAPRMPEPPAQAKTPPPAYMTPPEREPPAYRPAPTPPPTYTAPPPRQTWPENLPKPPAFEGREIRYETRSYERPDRAPAPQLDTLSEARRPDDKANLLTRAAFGGPDPLEEISGVGPMLHGLLNDIGVYYFWQIAEWGPEEISWVDSLLDGFNGRIDRDNWVGQAGILASKPETANRP